MATPTEIIISELVKAANNAATLYAKTKDQSYRDKEISYRRLAENFNLYSASGGSGGVSQIVAGSNTTISPVGGTGTVTINSTGGGATTLNDLTDVEVPSPSNGDIIKYDSGASMWIQWTPDYIATSGSYSNPSWLTSLAWSKITGEPTTISGYGITDGEVNTNKSTDVTLGGVSPSATLYTSEYAVKTYVDNQIAAAQAGIPTFEIDMFANYKVYQTDDAGLTIYVGKIKASSGAWLIEKYVDDGTGDLTVTYANVSNNATYTTPTTAWTNHTTLTYAAIDTLTGI